MDSGKKMACCYFPTTVIMVDDKVEFLNSLQLKIAKSLPSKTFKDSTEALTFLQSIQKNTTFIDRCIVRPADDEINHRNIDVNISEIHKEIYNPNRFGEVSVLLVDYAMPGLNGAELCQQLKGHRYKIVLLTGER
jgi:CheY-like chemotaxis protein